MAVQVKWRCQQPRGGNWQWTQRGLDLELMRSGFKGSAGPVGWRVTKSQSGAAAAGCVCEDSTCFVNIQVLGLYQCRLY